MFTLGGGAATIIDESELETIELLPPKAYVALVEPAVVDDDDDDDDEVEGLFAALEARSPAPALMLDEDVSLIGPAADRLSPLLWRCGMVVIDDLRRSKCRPTVRQRNETQNMKFLTMNIYFVSSIRHLLIHHMQEKPTLTSRSHHLVG